MYMLGGPKGAQLSLSLDSQCIVECTCYSFGMFGVILWRMVGGQWWAIPSHSCIFAMQWNFLQQFDYDICLDICYNIRVIGTQKNKSKPQISRDLKYTNILNVAAIKFVSDVWLSNHHDIYANHCHSISINCHSCQGPSSYWSRPAVVYFFQPGVLFSKKNTKVDSLFQCCHKSTHFGVLFTSQ